MITVSKGAVGVNGITMPLGPPTSCRIRFITIVAMAGKEVNIIETRKTWVAAFSVGVEGLGEVDLNKVPVRANGTVRSVRDKEKAVDRLGDRGVQRRGIVGR